MIARIVAVFLATACFSGVARAAPELVLNTSFLAPYTTEDSKGFFNLVVVEVFRRIGLEARVQVYRSSRRSLANSNGGLDDGEAGRVGGIEKKFSNLVPVPEVVLEIDFVAYSSDPDIKIANFADLKSYLVGFVSGWQIFQRNIDPGVNLTTVTSADQLMELLRLGRVDTILYERWQGLWRAKEKGMKVQFHRPPLASRGLYMYLHKKHAALVPKAAAALAEMKRDGTYARIMEQTLHRLTQ